MNNFLKYLNDSAIFVLPFLVEWRFGDAIIIFSYNFLFWLYGFNAYGFYGVCSLFCLYWSFCMCISTWLVLLNSYRWVGHLHSWSFYITMVSLVVSAYWIIWGICFFWMILLLILLSYIAWVEDRLAEWLPCLLSVLIIFFIWLFFWLYGLVKIFFFGMFCYSLFVVWLAQQRHG